MKPIVAVSALALLAGCVALPPRAGYPPRISYRLPPYAYRYATPVYPAPQATAAQLPASRPQTGDPYNPYTPEQMTAGIAEATGLAALISGGEWSPPLPGGGGGRPGPFISPDVPSPRASPPEPYNCAWGYASLSTCVGGLQ